MKNIELDYILIREDIIVPCVMCDLPAVYVWVKTNEALCHHCAINNEEARGKK